MIAPTGEGRLSDDLLGLAEQKGVGVDDTTPPVSLQVVAGRTRLHVLDWAGEGPPVVLLHGGGLHAHVWDLVCLGLRGTYRCVAIDQRGHGESEWSPGLDYTVDAHVGDVHAVVESLGLDEPALVGHSMGGINAAGYVAQRHPARALVVVDTGPTIQEAGAGRILQLMREPLELESVDAFVEHIAGDDPARDRRALRASLVNNLRQLPVGTWTWKYDMRARLRDDLEALAKERRLAVWPKLARAGCPCLIVRGEDSAVFSEADAATFAGLVPGALRATIPGSGHSVHRDNPGDLVDAIRTFLTEVDA